MHGNSPDDLMSLQEAASVLGVSFQTVFRWTKSGKLSAFLPRGRTKGRMVRRTDIEALRGLRLDAAPSDVKVLRLDQRATVELVLALIDAPPPDARVALRYRDGDDVVELDLTPLSADMLWAAAEMVTHPERIIRAKKKDGQDGSR